VLAGLGIGVPKLLFPPVPEREGVKFQDKVYRLSLEMVYIC
jgi:hypothetical protein